MDMMNMSRRSRRAQAGYRFGSALVVGLVLVVSGAFNPGRVDGTVSAQTLSPCALLTADEIKSLADETDVGEGVAHSLASIATCRYIWGVGIGRFTLDVIVTDASQMFPGLSPDQIKQRLVASVRSGTQDAVVSEIGEAAVFKPDSPVYASATSFVKGRILQVHLDGISAREKKDQLIGLLKSAASRL
jgi:hypothetical protein